MSDAKLAKCAQADEAECHGVHLMTPSGTSRALTSRNRVFVLFVKLMGPQPLGLVLDEQVGR
jgi:hypothetical protein